MLNKMYQKSHQYLSGPPSPPSCLAHLSSTNRGLKQIVSLSSAQREAVCVRVYVRARACVCVCVRIHVCVCVHGHAFSHSPGSEYTTTLGTGNVEELTTQHTQGQRWTQTHHSYYFVYLSGPSQFVLVSRSLCLATSGLKREPMAQQASSLILTTRDSN